MLNASTDLKNFTIADPPPKKKWFRAIDTGLSSPGDILLPGSEEPLTSQRSYPVKARSMVILISKEV